MNIFLSIEPAVTEALIPQASDTQVRLPEQDGVFDLMLSQLIQGIISLPLQGALPGPDQAVQAEDGMAGTVPSDGAGQEMTTMPPLNQIELVQSAFASTIRDLLNGVALSQEDAVPAADQAMQAEDGMAVTVPSDGAGQKMASMPPLTSTESVQSAFAVAIKDLPDGVATQQEALTGGSNRQTQTLLQEAFSSSSDQKAAAADAGVNPELTVRPDSKEGKMAGQKNAELVQLPVDMAKKTPAVEAQQPAVIREIILAGVDSKDMDDLPESQRRVEKTSLQETLPAGSIEPQGMGRLHAAPADTPAAATNAHHLSENMHVEGNRFVITRLDGTSIEISLQPEGLGKLDIGLVFDKGVLNAQIQASSAAGKELVEKHMSDIVNALAQEGISIGGFSVSLKDDRNDFSWNQSNSERHQIQETPVISKEYISVPRQLIDQGKVSIFI